MTDSTTRDDGRRDEAAQLSLFHAPRKRKPPPLPPHRDTESSREAAEMMRYHVDDARERVFRYVLAQGTAGATRYEAAADLDMPVQTAGPRVSELEKAGRIVFSGRHRPSPRGRKSRVYVANGVS